MCGIFGFISKQPTSFNLHIDSIENLMESSTLRGKEATGILAFNEKGKIRYLKSGLISKNFLKTKEYKTFHSACKTEKIVSIIGHSRLATNGSQLLDENNQPVFSEDLSLICIHNGILTNTYLLWENIKKSDLEPALDTKVMTEYLSYHSKTNGLIPAVKKFMTDMEGSASFALLEPQSKSLILATNTGSLYYLTDKNHNFLFFASEYIFLEKTADDLKLDKKSIQKIKPQTGIIYREGSINQFKANDDKILKNDFIFQSDSHEIIELEKISNLSRDKASEKLYQFQNNIDYLRRHTIDFERIINQKRCTLCILPASTPFILFDQYGVCNFCREHSKITYKGKDALERIIEKYRSKDGSPDCMAAFSGGRDSSYGLHYLKNELGLNPIAYTYDWGMVTDLARRNQARMLGKLGIEHLLLSADITKKRTHIRKNISAWMKDPHLGMVPLFMQGDKQCEFYADQLMKKYKLKLMFFFRGNEFEKEEFKNGHCGIKDADPGGVIHHLPTKDKLKLLSFYGSRYLKNPSYFNASIWDTGLAYFSTYIQQHDYLYLWHYIPWHEEEINRTLIEDYNWELAKESKQKWRTDDGSSAFYNYIYCQVQGFTENDSFRSRQIREGIIKREDALKIVLEENQPRYEALKWYFDHVGMDGSEVLSVVDKICKLY